MAVQYQALNISEALLKVRGKMANLPARVGAAAALAEELNNLFTHVHTIKHQQKVHLHNSTTTTHSYLEHMTLKVMNLR